MREVENPNRIEGGRLLVSGHNYALTQLDGEKISGFVYQDFNKETDSYEFSIKFLPQLRKIISIKRMYLREEIKNEIVIKGESRIRLEEISKDTS